MRLRVWPLLKGYLFAFVVSCIALGLTFWLSPLLDPNPYPFFVLAIVASAWFFGIGPGIFSTIFAFLAEELYFTPPLFVVTFTKQDITFLLFFMLVMAIAVSLMSAQKRGAEFRARLGAIVTGAQEAIIGLGLDGTIQSWNPGAERMYGYTAGEAMCQSIHLVSPPEIYPSFDAVLNRATTGEPTAQWETVLLGRSGKEIYVTMSVAPVYDRGGRITSLSLIVGDISERKQAEEQDRQKAARIEVQRRLLEQREQERQQIARDLHDGPVQALTGITLALRGVILDLPTKDLASPLETIQAALQEQIQELRAYAGELRPPSLEKFGLGKAIRSHLETVQEKHAELHLEFEDQSAGEWIPYEQGLALYRIAQECLTNILKHASARSATFRLSLTQDRITLEIQDDGAGFEVPIDWLEFARNGHLGLVGMRERAEAVGGTFEIQSHRGSGTLFRARVPRQMTQASEGDERVSE
jgi:two-component system, NarL family, sensor histidine kinase UhpB